MVSRPVQVTAWSTLLSEFEAAPITKITIVHRLELGYIIVNTRIILSKSSSPHPDHALLIRLQVTEKIIS